MTHNGVEYTQHALLHIDDILDIMDEHERFLREDIGKRFILKEKSIGSPEQCTGNKVSQVSLENGYKCALVHLNMLKMLLRM